MTVSPMVRPELPEARYSPAYEWDVYATTAGTEYQRACGITDDYDRACANVDEALNALPAGLPATGGISTAFPLGYLPGWPVAAVTRDASGVIAWSHP